VTLFPDDLCSKFLKALWDEIEPTREQFEREKNEKRENNRMKLVIFCEGLAETLTFNLDSIETLRSVPPSQAKAIAEGWADNLIHIIETGDGTLKYKSDPLTTLTIISQHQRKIQTGIFCVPFQRISRLILESQWFSPIFLVPCSLMTVRLGYVVGIPYTTIPRLREWC